MMSNNNNDYNISTHLKQVRKQLYLNLMSAFRGCWEWHKLNKNKEIDESFIILLPACDKEINYYALLYLDKLLDKRKYKKAVILTHDSVVFKCASLFSDRILYTIPFSRNKAEDLMQLYCLYDFSKRFIVASLDEPNGRNGNYLLGKKEASKEEIFAIGVYYLSLYNKPDKPKYTGNDPEILTFLNCVPK